MAGYVLGAAWLAVQVGVGVESWRWLALAAALPVIGWIGFVLAADPRTD